MVTGARLELVSYTGYIMNREAVLRWNISDVPSGYRGYTTGVAQYTKHTYSSEFTRTNIISSRVSTLSVTQTPRDAERGACTYFEIQATIYTNAGETAEVLTLVTPLYYSSGNSDYPTSPHSVVCAPEPTGGMPVTVYCETLESLQYLTLYYERSYDSGEWECIYSGKSLSYTDIPDDGHDTVQYRVYSRYANGRTSVPCPGEVMEIINTNVYVGVNGVPVRAKGIYLNGVKAGNFKIT